MYVVLKFIDNGIYLSCVCIHVCVLCAYMYMLIPIQSHELLKCDYYRGGSKGGLWGLETPSSLCLILKLMLQ